MEKHDELNFGQQSAPGYITISSVIDMIAEPFDSEAIAEKQFNENFNNPESRYYQMTKQDILDAWANKGAESRAYGQNLDKYIGICLTSDETERELFRMDYVTGDKRMEGLCAAFDSFYNKFVKDGPLRFIDRERTVYLNITNEKGETISVKGRFDALFYDERSGHYVVVDWKSNGNIECVPTKWTKKLLGPARSLYDLAGNKYTTQVFFYKEGLSKNNDIPEDQIDVMIVNLQGYDENDKPIFKCIGAQYAYDEKFLDDVFFYAYNKKQIMNRKK